MSLNTAAKADVEKGDVEEMLTAPTVFIIEARRCDHLLDEQACYGRRLTTAGEIRLRWLAPLPIQ